LVKDNINNVNVKVNVKGNVKVNVKGNIKVDVKG
jgi:hypothetical protein